MQIGSILPSSKWVAGALLSCLSYGASAQCSNSVTPSCGVYESCFAHYCDCSSSPDEYMMSYGKAYCEKFLGNADFSDAGKAWRDSTLVCLQEAIVPDLNIVEPPQACNCSAMRQKAFDSHVACYTQPGKSICDLPVDDLKQIQSIVAIKDTFSTEGWATMKQITQKCKDTATDPTRKTIWSAISGLLN